LPDSNGNGTPTKRKGSKCKESCENNNTRLKILEKEKTELSQAVQNLKTHQETLRATITAQKSLIKEEQLKTQVHNNLAMMFLDEVVDEGDSITPEERANKVAELKEVHNINNDLQKQLQVSGL
jgi:hypothetical protein